MFYTQLIETLKEGSIKATGQDTVRFKAVQDRRRRFQYDLSRPLGTERRAVVLTTNDIFDWL